MASTTTAKRISGTEVRIASEKSLFYFAKNVLGYDKLDRDVHGRVCEILESGSDRDIVLMPRGSYKTSLCTIAFPIWMSLRNPDLRILIVSAVGANAKAILREIRETFEGNEDLRKLWPDVVPERPDRDGEAVWTRSELTLLRPRPHKEATFTALGTDSHMASKHFGLILCDDIVDEQTSQNKNQLKATIEWFSKIYGLAEDIMTTRIVLVGTRWHHHDLYGHLRKKEGGKWGIHIRRALEKMPDGTMRALLPHWTVARLEEMRREMGSFLFSANMLNEPVDDENSAFPYEIAKTWDDEGERPLGIFIGVSVDPAISTEDDADESAVVVCGRDSKGKIYILDWFQGKVLPEKTCDVVINMIIKWQPDMVGVEASGFQKMLKFRLQERMMDEGVTCPIRGLKHNGRSKGARILALQPYYESGRLMFRKSGADEEILNQLSFYPKYDRDDLADALAYQLEILIRPMDEEVEPEDNRTHSERVMAQIEKEVTQIAQEAQMERFSSNEEDYWW